MEQRGLHETVQRRVEWFIRSEIPDCSFSNLIWEVAVILLIIIQLYSLIIQSFIHHVQLLRILLKQDTALLSHVSQSVSVCVTGVTSQVFSII